MPRRNRQERDPEEWDPSHLRAGWRRTEVRRGSTWNVQPISGAQATKQYVCPGCGLTIEAGVAHLVAWRADGILGDASDLESRRHWHEHCWKVG